MPQSASAEPYTDAAYLADEATFVSIRCSRIGFEREIADRPMGCFGPTAAEDPRGTPKQQARLASLLAEEGALRAHIDARLEATRSLDPRRLGVHRLTADHDLSANEVVALILAAMPCVSTTAAEPLAACSGFCFAVATPVTETVGVWLGLDFEARIGLRKMLNPECRLVRDGLIHFERQHIEPHEWAHTGYWLTQGAWAILAGESEPGCDAQTRCEKCGLVVP